MSKPTEQQPTEQQPTEEEEERQYTEEEEMTLIEAEFLLEEGRIDAAESTRPDLVEGEAERAQQHEGGGPVQGAQARADDDHGAREAGQHREPAHRPHPFAQHHG